MKKIFIASGVLLILIVFGGCYSQNSPNESAAVSQDYNTNAADSAQDEAPLPNSKDAGQNRDPRPAESERDVSTDRSSPESQQNEKVVKPIERKIIRNAELRLETPSPEETQRKITAIAENKKGFVVNSTQRNANAKLGVSQSVSMTLRIPSENFRPALDEIRKTADRVVVENVTGKDVTEEFVDIEARLKTKKALEARFLEIMKSARSVSDALQVERQLNNVRTEIERIEGRKKFLENQTSLSTISVNLQTPTAISASSTGFFYELKKAISDGFEAALTFILFLIRILIALIPFFLLVVLPIFLIARYFLRRWKKRRASRKTIEEELAENIDDK